jgi:hypothetical protein
MKKTLIGIPLVLLAAGALLFQAVKPKATPKSAPVTIAEAPAPSPAPEKPITNEAGGGEVLPSRGAPSPPPNVEAGFKEPPRHWGPCMRVRTFTNMWDPLRVGLQEDAALIQAIAAPSDGWDQNFGLPVAVIEAAECSAERLARPDGPGGKLLPRRNWSSP